MKMPRQARQKSESNIYHIMMRGINRQQIFEDPQDNEKFLEVLRDYKAISGYKIFAYCLMGNHFHLLMQFNKEPIEQAMKRICGRFVYWYNVKYGRTGHLFQDRFKSEPIDNDRYFLACLRYIHQNPVKAGISKIEQYPYSSYNSYLKSECDELVDTDLLYTLLSREQYAEFCNQSEQLKFLEISEKGALKVTDEEAKNIMFEITGCKNVSEFQNSNNDIRQNCLHLLKEKGLGIRQICRLTGESFYSVQKS